MLKNATQAFTALSFLSPSISMEQPDILMNYNLCQQSIRKLIDYFTFNNENFDQQKSQVSIDNLTSKILRYEQSDASQKQEIVQLRLQLDAEVVKNQSLNTCERQNYQNNLNQLFNERNQYFTQCQNLQKQLPVANEVSQLQNLVQSLQSDLNQEIANVVVYKQLLKDLQNQDKQLKADFGQLRMLYDQQSLLYQQQADKLVELEQQMNQNGFRQSDLITALDNQQQLVLDQKLYIDEKDAQIITNGQMLEEKSKQVIDLSSCVQQLEKQNQLLDCEVQQLRKDLVAQVKINQKLDFKFQKQSYDFKEQRSDFVALINQLKKQLAKYESDMTEWEKKLQEQRVLNKVTAEKALIDIQEKSKRNRENYLKECSQALTRSRQSMEITSIK